MKYAAQYPCRCRGCGHRRTLPRHPDAYVRPHACWYCKRRSWRVDRFRRMREHQKYACTCGGIEGIYNWAGPHRKGSKWCVYSTNEPAAEELIERMGWQ